MQTRKKSISLHALGVIPAVPRGSAAHRSNSNSSNPSTSTAPAQDSHPAKRLKRSHTVSTDASHSSSPASPASPPHRRRNASATIDRQRQLPASQTTPPPSPGEHHPGKLDTSGIGDDIVVGVLRQLEVTGNRPHQIKELATALSGTLRSVDSSANPVAIISSRLTNYLRRPWTAIAPCPLAKEQVNIHPRRVYYFLTTAPRQQIPDYLDISKTPARVITPSISSGPDDEDNPSHEPTHDRKRDAMSPSPELDTLELPGLDINPMAGLAFGDPTHQHYGQQPIMSYMDSRRAASPPLEHDEREFTQAATSVANRAQNPGSQSAESLVQEHLSESPAPIGASATPGSPDEMVYITEESEEAMALRNQEAATALFGHGSDSSRLGMGSQASPAFGSSPMLRPLTSNTTKDIHFKPSAMRRFDDMNLDTSFRNDFDVWGDLKSPEAVGLSELDDMLGGF